MSDAALRSAAIGLRWLPVIFLLALLFVFAGHAPRFLTPANLSAILVQASWLVIVASGVNFVLLVAGVDLSAGAVMYLIAVACTGAFGSYAGAWPVLAVVLGIGAGIFNASLILKARIPAFVATLGAAFVLRGIALYVSDTKMVFAPEIVADLARARILLMPLPLLIAAVVVGVSYLVLSRTAFGIRVRAIGADAGGARRAGLPIGTTLISVYAIAGGFAGLGGLVSFAQNSAAASNFGMNAEFLAIAACVLGGTSLFGGRGSAWAPLIGAVLIMTVQNGLVLIDANPYAYPVMTGMVIFLAAFLDSVRTRLLERLERRPILVTGR